MRNAVGIGGRIVTMAALALLLSACSGDDGAPGPAGPAGPPGATGTQGDPGATGGTGGVPIGSAEKINIEVMSVEVSSGSEAPMVKLRLTNDLTQGLTGLDASEIRFVLSQLSDAPAGSGESSAWQSYVTRDSGGLANAQATTETASSDRFTDNGDGTYTYTFAMALDDYPAGPVFDPVKTHRLGVEIRGQAPISSNGIIDFVPAGGNPLFTRNIVDNDTCNACHDVFSFHGGPRTDITYCVTCHNPSSIDGDTGSTVDMTAMIHNIHAGRDGYSVIGFGGTVHDYSDIQFTQDVRNCETCHQEGDADTPQASNWREMANRASCGTCHFDDGDPDNGANDYAIEDGMHAAGLLFSDDTQCLDCHGPEATVQDGTVQTAFAHRIPSLEASGQFVYNIVNVRNVSAGAMPEVDYSVTDANGDVYDLDTAPEFTACGDGTSRLSVNIAWTTHDFTNEGSGAENATPVMIDALGADCGGAGTDTDGDGVFTATSPVAIPAGLTGSIAVALEGHPGSDLNEDGIVAGRSERIAVTNAIAYFGIDGADPTPRRNAVAIEKCADCHKQLSLHGSNRTDKPEVCAMCHNPNATDIEVRVADSECVTELGADDQPIDLKNMIHGIHAGNIGVCGFRNSAHPYFDVVYPGRLQNCEGCHNPGGYYPVEPGTLLGTTFDANDPTTPTDDRVVSPNTAVCSACHTSEIATQHMIQNGGDFNASKAADSSLISSGVETCTLCHGAGRSSDVKAVHGIDDFQFN